MLKWLDTFLLSGTLFLSLSLVSSFLPIVRPLQEAMDYAWVILGEKMITKEIFGLIDIYFQTLLFELLIFRTLRYVSSNFNLGIDRVWIENASSTTWIIIFY